MNNLLSRKLVWNLLWPAIPTGSAIKGINHQWSAGRCGKECSARVHVQAASEDDEQKHKKTVYQRVVLDVSIHRSSLLPFSHVRLLRFLRRTPVPLSSAAA